MSWTDRMSRAAFRGLEFLTDSHDAKGGRRLVLHEYPGAEVQSVEDLGAATWEWKLNAYFISADYDQARNDFLSKLAEPGADWLTHPWLGLLYVRAKSWSLHESNDKGGYCTIAVDFVPGGETVQPVPDKVDVAVNSCSALRSAALDDFDLEAMSAGGMTAFIAAVQQRLETLRRVISFATLPLAWAGQINNLIAGVKGDLDTLLALPAAYAAALRGLADTIGGGADDSGLPDTDRPRVISRLISAADATKISATLAGAISAGVTGTDAITGGTATSTGATVAEIDGAVQRNLAREQSLRARLLVSAAAEVALTGYRAEIDRDAALDAVTRAIDALLPDLPDAVFQAAVSLRAALADALLAQDLKPAATRDVAASLPAIVLAHRLNVDEAVFITRNAVRHPLFVKGRVYG